MWPRQRATKPGRKVTKVWEVQATTAAIMELAGHLAGLGIERVVLEATSDYWRCWHYLLSAAGIECWLVNAREVKNVPGRPKSDKLDAVVRREVARCEWLRRLEARLMRGVIRSSVRGTVPALACVAGNCGVRSPGESRSHCRPIRGWRARGRPDG